MSTQLDLRRLSPTRRAFVAGFRRAYSRASIEFREELAVLADAHREEMAKLARFYDAQLANLSGDFAALAHAHREDKLRHAIAEAEAERATHPFALLH